MHSQLSPYFVSTFLFRIVSLCSPFTQVSIRFFSVTCTLLLLASLAVVSTIDGALQLISHSYGRQCPGIRLCNKDERATMLTLPCGDPNCRQCLVANQKRRCATCACLLHAAQLTCPCGALRPPRRAGHHGAAAAAGKRFRVQGSGLDRVRV